MKLGLFGGTFNPVHLGHLIMAQDAMEQYELDRILFIPANIPPHKTGHEIVGSEYRLSMLEAVVESNPCFEVSDLELRREGVSFTVDTVREMQAFHPEAELFFLIGADSLFELHTWRDIETLLGRCTFITFARPGFNLEAITPERLNLSADWTEKLKRQVTFGHAVEISSSDIRHRVAEGMSVRYLVPPEVEMVILEHGLYSS